MATKTIVLNEDGIEHLRKLVDYNWQDELRDFEQHEGRKTATSSYPGRVEHWRGSP
jgi:hypothetical protein